MDGDVKNDTVHHMCGFLPISNDNFPLENESSGWIRNPFSIITPDFSSKDMERCIKLVQWRFEVVIVRWQPAQIPVGSTGKFPRYPKTSCP